MKNLLCKIFGHSWIENFHLGNSDIPLGHECKRCGLKQFNKNHTVPDWIKKAYLVGMHKRRNWNE